jgi:hypothetical protein
VNGNPLALRRVTLQIAAHQGGLAELVDALDSKSSSNECGFESHSRYFTIPAVRPGFSATNGMAHPRIIGIIAGSGVYPETFIAAARRESPGVKLVVAAFHGRNEAELADQADAVEWFRVASSGK